MVVSAALGAGALWSSGAMTLSEQEAAPVAKSKSDATTSDQLKDIKPDFEALILKNQEAICEGIAKLDGKEFRVDSWERPNGHGMGRSMVLQDGNVFEKAGVNVSVVRGTLSPAAAKAMRSRGKETGSGEEPPFFAAGISLVIHPKNPMAPTVHLNYRYFEVIDDSGKTSWWFGGGSDLTPSYLREEDAIEFHSDLKAVCDKHDPEYFGKFKKWCDEYFYNPHRKESRGVGGIFFDDLDQRPANADPKLDDREAIFAFSSDCLTSFLPTYLKIMQRRKDEPFTEKQKEWQALRRGRYVEFNLVYDRGTKFGLNTPKNVRIESMLVSLPLHARWEYMHEVKPGSEEDKLEQVLRTPRDWAVDKNELKNASFEDIMAELTKRSKAQAEQKKQE